mgnify:FL=1
MRLVYCVLYLALLGVLCFPFGRLLARHDFRADQPPFQSLPLEQNGKIYEKLGIRKWQNRVPDVSKVMPNIVPRKAMEKNLSFTGLYRMVQETCVAEMTHVLLCFAGIALLWIWPGAGGIALYILYVVLGNIPFILIQRYNRPRLQRLLLAAERRERRIHESSDPQQQ